MKEFRDSISPLQIIGGSISIIVTITLLFSGNDTLASLSVGLLVATLTQLLQLQIGQEKSEKQLLKSIGLRDNLFSDAWLVEQLETIINDYIKIKDDIDFPYFDVCAKDSINESRKFVHALTEGYASIPHRSKLGLELDELIFANAKRSIWSVAIIDMDYWRSSYGQNYLQTNIVAQANGADIVRIFMCPGDKIEQISDILLSQNKLGFKVYFVPKEDIKKELQFDYHIIDSKIFTSLETTSGSEEITSIRVSIDDIEVDKWVKKFDITLRYAKLIDDEFIKNLGNERLT